MNMETIFAPATAPGRAGIAVIRISGPQTRGAVQALVGRIPSPRRTSLATFRDESGAPLDEGLVLWFPGPGSYTGEDMAELHCHGGPATIAALVAALSVLDGLRVAEAGEFTRRAYRNGRMDLTQAEAVADLIAADTEAQRRSAVAQLGGRLSSAAEAWRLRLIDLQAAIEADLDFSDEGDVSETVPAVVTGVGALRDELRAALSTSTVGERLRTGLQVALIGAPNAGKSSLLNALARRDAAIVTDRPGTTRDVLEVHLDLAGFPVTIADTAGLRETKDSIEAEGVRRAENRAEASDLRILVVDGIKPQNIDANTIYRRLRPGDLILWNKQDSKAYSPPPSHPSTFEEKMAGTIILEGSVRSGTGLAALESHLARSAAEHLEPGEGVVLTRERHREAVGSALAALERAAAVPEPELLAEDLRLAARAVGRIAGKVDVEDVLDAVFSRFCIGK